MHPSLTLICSLLALGASTMAFSQTPSTVNSEAKVDKIEPSYIESPKIASAFTKRASAGGGRLQWLEVETTFERTAPSHAGSKFADELTVNYYILLKNQGVTTDKKATMLSGSVTHIHVPEGKDLHSSIYLSPRTIARLFEGKAPTSLTQLVSDIGVTISSKQGLLAAAAWKTQVTKDGKGWWDNPAQQMTPLTGVLLNKNETPFAPLEWDFFELIKPKSSN